MRSRFLRPPLYYLTDGTRLNRTRAATGYSTTSRNTQTQFVKIWASLIVYLLLMKHVRYLRHPIIPQFAEELTLRRHFLRAIQRAIHHIDEIACIGSIFQNTTPAPSAELSVEYRTTSVISFMNDWLRTRCSIAKS